MPPKKKTTTIATTASATTTDAAVAASGGNAGPATKKQRRGSPAASGSASAPASATTTTTKADNKSSPSSSSQNPPASTTPTGSGSAAAASAPGGPASSSSTAAATTTTTTTSNTNTKTNKQIKIASGSSAMDNHPYARGSVIEVLHGVKESNDTGDDGMQEEKKDCDYHDYDDDDSFDEWWDKDSDDDDEDDKNSEENENENKNENENENKDTNGSEIDGKASGANKEENKNKGKRTRQNKNEVVISVRLCDIIDRVAVESANGDNNNSNSNNNNKPSDGTTKWRYYVHYRDFNRRMDEWISMDRIVSPPSIGNAKARAIKREEEKKKRMLQREKEKEEKRRAALKARSVDVTAPRASRRRSAAPSGAAASGSGGTGQADTGAEGGSVAADPGGASAASEGAAPEQEGTRRGTRLRRKSSAVGGGDADENANAGTNAAGNNDGDSGPSLPVMAAEKGTVALPTIAATDSTKVGEHVVQTIAAQELDEHEGLDDAALREHEEVTKVKNVAFLELGPHQMSTWYFSPLPKELLSERGFIEVLYVCEFTLRMFSRKQEIRRFQARLPADRRHPPGNEIYRKGNLSMFEVDGFEERIYCQNLCYIAKLFLDHKTLYFDVDPFLFYVLCEVDERGFHPVGYYSKEKYSDVGYNLACILTFPSHQRKGYGRFLIAFSYELSKKEEKVGSPEKPMSDLGQQAYKPYWASTIVDFLLNQCPNANSMSIMDISKMTSIMAEDIVFTLNQLSILKIINGVYFIAAEEGLLRTLAKKYPVKEPRVDPSKLHWTPFVMDVKRDKFSIHSKKPSVEGEETRGAGGF